MIFKISSYLGITSLCLALSLWAIPAKADFLDEMIDGAQSWVNEGIDAAGKGVDSVKQGVNSAFESTVDAAERGVDAVKDVVPFSDVEEEKKVEDETERENEK